MALFSRRQGLIKPEPKGKPEELSEGLRTALWNDFYRIYVSHVERYGLQPGTPMVDLLRSVWSEHLGYSADDYPRHEKMIKEIRGLFTSNEWFVPLDLVELVYANAVYLGINQLGFEQHVNERLVH